MSGSRPDWAVEGRKWPHRAASRFVEAGGLRWHVQILGAGPVLLLLHGTAAATHSWRGLIPLLAPHFTIVAPDLPGHGFTGPLRRPSLPGIAGALVNLLKTLDVAPAMTVGHSAGAAIMLRMALDGGPTGTALVSIGGALLPFPGLAGRLFPGLAKLIFVNPLMPRILAMRARLPGESASFLARATGSRIDAEGADLYGRLLGSPGHIAGALGMMAHWDLDSLARDYPRLGVPLTLLHGDRDATVPVAVAGGAAARLKGAAVEVLPGLGHLAHEENPASVAGIILRIAREHGILTTG